LEPRRLRSFPWAYLALVILSLALMGYGGFLAWKLNVWSVAAAGAASVLVVLSAWPIASALRSIRAEQRELVESKITTMNDTMDQMTVLLNQISEQQLLSDRAKSVAFREKERDALRRAIQEEIARQDWEAALVLANDIETGFGYPRGRSSHADLSSR
jgi:hypothetical protein